MTKNHVHELMPILKAFAEGKTIQALIGKEWVDVHNPDFDRDPRNYRIKPVLRTFWVNSYAHGYSELHPSKDRADNYASHDRIECIQLKEVMKE